MIKKKLVNFSKNPDMVRIASEFSDEFSLHLQCTLDKSVILTKSTVYIVTPNIKNILLLIVRSCLLKRTIIGIHDVVSHERTDFYKVWIYNYIICILASKVIVFSKFSLEELVAKFPVKRKNIMVYHFGKNLKPVRKMKTIDCLFFGRGLSYTGMHFIPEIAQRMPDLSFKVISRNAHRLTVVPHNLTIVPNFVDDAELFSAIASTRVILLPYVSATQSGAIPLAASANAQIIAFDVGGLSEQCSEVFGKFAPPSDINEIVRLIRQSVSSPQKIDYDTWRLIKMNEQTVQI